MESPLMPRILPKFPKSNFQRILDRILHANKLADFTAFKNTPEDFKTKQQESFQFVESTFPFYIRPEHHVMSLLVPGNSKGEYWGDAAHFLLSNKAHGFPLWSEFEKQIRSTDTKISCMPHISTNMTKLILKHEQHHQLDQADGAWFASSPFVLAQLPFQPVLLFQWLTQSLFLLSNFEMQMRGRKDLPDDTTWRKAMKDWNINIETKVNEITKSARKKHHDYDYLMKNNLEFKKRMKKVKRRSSGLAVEPRDSRILEFGNEYSVSTIKLTDSLDIQYEVRCQNIVSQCIGAHLNIENFEKEKDNAMRDWQVVQFLLPCFISLYRVITAAEDSQNDLRQWYEKFLDKLISTFEDEKVGVRRSSWANILKDIQNNPDLLSENTHEELLKFFDRVSNKFITKVKICQTAFDHLARCGFFRAFYEVLETNYGKNKKSSAQSNDIATKPSVYWNWLMWDFFDRMEQAMKEAK
ncbi:Hypothetical predicted protein [Cloeon dipterum]|uniref:Uncharacterized protein n=1 Tax=Cloeon dipterum TaxID=197152 RepID=A0A8S1DMT1_9INSE|nr:Hypothetical predicted protein [Cloeon dipterum]